MVRCLPALLAGHGRQPPILPHLATGGGSLAHTSDEDLRNRNSSIFHYVDALCYGIERLGDPAVIPLLVQLHSYPFLRNHRCPQGFQPDYFQERQAYLEVVIGRTLARCGSPQGIVLLIDYLDDARALLAEHAHSELVAISGEDFGKSASLWSQWLEAHGDALPPAPWRQPSDPVQAWREVVLTTPAEREKAIYPSAKNRDEPV